MIVVMNDREWFLNHSQDDRVIVSLYFIGSFMCMLLSSLMHCFTCTSQAVLWSKADYTGILCLLGSSDIPMLYFGFESYPTIRLVYFILLPIVLCLGSYSLFSEKMQTPERKLLRLIAFASVALFGWFHMVHEIILKNSYETTIRILNNWFSSFSFYIIGVFFYASHIPEKYVKKSFDIIGSSHQIWHLLVLGGAIYHVRTIHQYSICR
jgi:adiponectin receptor